MAPHPERMVYGLWPGFSQNMELAEEESKNTTEGGFSRNWLHSETDGDKLLPALEGRQRRWESKMVPGLAIFCDEYYLSDTEQPLGMSGSNQAHELRKFWIRLKRSLNNLDKVR